MASLFLLLTVIFIPPVLNQLGYIPPFGPIVSSISTYNYNLAKYLCPLLKLHNSSEFVPQILSLFVKGIHHADFRDMFMASYDVTSLFTKIVYVNKETGFSVVMLHYPKFQGFKALNVQFMSVPLSKAFTVQT